MPKLIPANKKKLYISLLFALLLIALLILFYPMYAPHRLFFRACSQGDVSVVKTLLKSGIVDINHEFLGIGGITPLMGASQRGQVEIVKLLIENGADVNIKSHLNGPALNYATIMGHDDVVEILLKHGAKVNMTDNDAKTALDYASDDKIVELLKAYGAKTGFELGAEQSTIPSKP